MPRRSSTRGSPASSSGSGTTAGPCRWRAASLPAAGVVRVQHVYTPATLRGAGYATACVEHMSRGLTNSGLRCVLYTDLANPTSNGIYRRIGYEAVAEILGYQFA